MRFLASVAAVVALPALVALLARLFMEPAACCAALLCLSTEADVSARRAFRASLACVRLSTCALSCAYASAEAASVGFTCPIAPEMEVSLPFTASMAAERVLIVWRRKAKPSDMVSVAVSAARCMR